MDFVNRYNFNDPQLADLARQLEGILNGNLEGSNFTSVTSSGLTGKYCKTKRFGNFLVAGEVFGIFYSPDTISIIKLFLSIGAVADQDITVEIYKNDVATGQIATLSSGTKSEMTILGSPLSFIETDKVSLKVITCGSDNDPGQDLDCDLYYEI